MAVAALLSTAGATNATLYASSNLTAMLAKEQLFPPRFGMGPRLGPRLAPKSGLIVTAALVFIVANLVDLSAIASVGSAVALTIFLLVGAAGYRLRHETGSNTLIVLLAIGVTGLVLAFFIVDTLRNAPQTFVAILAIGLLAIVLDVIWNRMRPATDAPAQLTPSA
jgi:amino acid transporter